MAQPRAARPSASATLQHEVDLVAFVGAKAVRRRRCLAPANLLGQLYRDETLEQPAEQRAVVNEVEIVDYH